MGLGIVQTPAPPRRNRDWLQPQTVLSKSPNPVISLPLGPKNK